MYLLLPVAPPFSQSPRETKAASHVLQTVWSYKELRNALTKDGWNKSHFQVESCDPECWICYLRFLKTPFKKLQKTLLWPCTHTFDITSQIIS